MRRLRIPRGLRLPRTTWFHFSASVWAAVASAASLSIEAPPPRGLLSPELPSRFLSFLLCSPIGPALDPGMYGADPRKRGRSGVPRETDEPPPKRRQRKHYAKLADRNSIAARKTKVYRFAANISRLRRSCNSKVSGPGARRPPNANASLG